MRLLGWAVGVATTVSVVLAAAVPLRLDRGTVGRAVDGQLASMLGIRTRVDGRVTLKLLPRPRLRIAGLTATARDGAVLVDAPEVSAELDIASLLGGRWRLASATLLSPTVTIDVDRAGDLALLHAGLSRDPSRLPLKIRTRSGVLRTVSANAALDSVLTDIDAAAMLPGGGGAFSGSGTVTWRGAPARFAARIEHLADVGSAAGSPASLQIISPVLTLSADGDLSSEPQRRFAGHLAALVPSLPRLLQGSTPAERPGAGRIQLAGDLVASAHGLAFSDASFRMNRGRFEGTLAIRREGPGTSVEGTLATDLLDVDSLVAEDAGEGSLASLYGRPFASDALTATVDLRISATRTRIGRLALDDTALTLLARGGRLELSLDEASLCGGRVKGRAVTWLAPGGASAHVEATAARVDVGALAVDLGGDGQIGGSLTGEAVLDGQGRTLREIVAGLNGRGQVTVEGGRIAGLSLGRTLSRFGARLPIAGFRGDRPTVFDKAVWPFTVDNGVMKIPEGKLTAPGVAMSFSGETRLPEGRVDIAGTAVETDAAGAQASGSPRLPFTMRGTWDGSLLLVGHTGAGGLAPLVLPLIGAAPHAP